MMKRCDVRIDISPSSCGEEFSHDLKAFYVYFAIGCLLNVMMAIYYFVAHLRNSNGVWKPIHKIILCGTTFCALQFCHSVGVLMEIKSAVVMEALAMVCWSFAMEALMDYCKEWYHIVLLGQSYGVSHRKQKTKKSKSSSSARERVANIELEQNSKKKSDEEKGNSGNNTTNCNSNDEDTDYNTTGVNGGEGESDDDYFACDVTTVHNTVFKFIPQKPTELFLSVIQRCAYIVESFLFIYAGYCRDKGDYKGHSLYASMGFAVFTMINPFSALAIILYGGEVLRMLKVVNIKVAKKEELLFRIQMARFCMASNYSLYSLILAFYASYFDYINTHRQAGVTFIFFCLGLLPPTITLICYSLGLGSQSGTNQSNHRNGRNRGNNNNNSSNSNQSSSNQSNSINSHATNTMITTTTSSNNASQQ